MAGWLGRESRAERIKQGDGVLWRKWRVVFYLGGGSKEEAGNHESLAN